MRDFVILNLLKIFVFLIFVLKWLLYYLKQLRSCGFVWLIIDFLDIDWTKLEGEGRSHNYQVNRLVAGVDSLCSTYTVDGKAMCILSKQAWWSVKSKGNGQPQRTSHLAHLLHVALIVVLQINKKNRSALFLSCECLIDTSHASIERMKYARLYILCCCDKNVHLFNINICLAVKIHLRLL